MSRYRARTLRRMPSATREIARLANELASVQTRLSNRVEKLASMEMMANASLRMARADQAHAALAHAALLYLQARDDPDCGDSARIETLAQLRRAVAPFDPDRLFEEDD